MGFNEETDILRNQNDTIIAKLMRHDKNMHSVLFIYFDVYRIVVETPLHLMSELVLGC